MFEIEHVAVEPALEDTWTTYTKDLSIADVNANPAVLHFLLGNESGTVTMDNVKLVKRSDPPTVNDYVHIAADQYWNSQGTALTASGEGDKDLTGMEPGDNADYKFTLAQAGRYVPSIRVSSTQTDSVVNLQVLDDGHCQRRRPGRSSSIEGMNRVNEQISGIIKGMQQNTSQSVKVVVEGVLTSHKTGEAFENIISVLNESAQRVTEIAAASEEQAAQSLAKWPRN